MIYSHFPPKVPPNIYSTYTQPYTYPPTMFSTAPMKTNIGKTLPNCVPTKTNQLAPNATHYAPYPYFIQPPCRTNVKPFPQQQIGSAQPIPSPATHQQKTLPSKNVKLQPYHPYFNYMRPTNGPPQKYPFAPMYRNNLPPPPLPQHIKPMQTHMNNTTKQTFIKLQDFNTTRHTPVNTSSRQAPLYFKSSAIGQAPPPPHAAYRSPNSVNMMLLMNNNNNNNNNKNRSIKPPPPTVSLAILNNQNEPIIIDEDDTTTQEKIELPKENNQQSKLNMEPQKALISEEQHMKNMMLDRIKKQKEEKWPSTFKSTIVGKSDREYYSHVVHNAKVELIPCLIRRDVESTPTKVKLFKNLMRHHYKDKWEEHYQIGSIDYCHMQEHHVSQVNSLLSVFFWPDIDLSDGLSEPELSVIVLYKRLVIGCGFITPQGYIPYLFTHPEWRRNGIAKFMLCQLIKSLDGCSSDPSVEDDYVRKELVDITLHVNSSNKGSIALCEMFGFKSEEKIVDFYRNLHGNNINVDRKQEMEATFYRLKR
ncbi:hypothetical protein AKO1_010159 [Acrasis kona]|uniref:N-acetyltransferase domain-containing protein n=1 Tax=Acrasis kona TaxID=1008807 RepID=A0AAW2ZQH0_9EUKA